MADYPSVDSERSGYVAAIGFGGFGLLRFPGAHGAFSAAAERARKIAAALRDSGEDSVHAHVVYCGERPRGFPHNGVRV